MRMRLRDIIIKLKNSTSSLTFALIPLVEGYLVKTTLGKHKIASNSFFYSLSILYIMSLLK